MAVLYAYFFAMLVVSEGEKNTIVHIASTIAHTLSIVLMSIGIATSAYYYIVFAMLHDLADMMFICFDNKEDNRHFAIIIFTAIIEAVLLGYLIK